MKLLKFLNKKKMSLKHAAKELHFSYEDIRRYTSGKAIPRVERMKKIISWSKGKVTPNDFYLTEE